MNYCRRWIPPAGCHLPARKLIPVMREQRSRNGNARHFDRERCPARREPRPTDRERRPTMRERRPQNGKACPFDRERRPFRRERRPRSREDRPTMRERCPTSRKSRPGDRERRMPNREVVYFDRERLPNGREQRPTLRERRPTTGKPCKTTGNGVPQPGNPSRHRESGKTAFLTAKTPRRRDFWPQIHTDAHGCNRSPGGAEDNSPGQGRNADAALG